MARKANKTLADVVTAVGRVESAVEDLTEEVSGIRTRLDGQAGAIEQLTDEVGGLKADVGIIKTRVDNQGDLAAEVRRLVDGQSTLVNAVVRFLDLEGRVKRIEAKVFSTEH